MKNILSTLLILGILVCKGQDTAILKVQIINDVSQPLQGEQIIFFAQDKSYETKGISGKDGWFEVALLGDKTYDIRLKTIGEAEQYNTIKIPALPPNTIYGDYQLTITIFPAKQFTLNNVLFESAKSTLKSESKRELDELYEYLSLKPDVKILIAGHTDNQGDDESNLILSEERAKSVMLYLIEKGINSDRLSTIGYGSSKAVADNSSAEGRKINRRTEIIIL